MGSDDAYASAAMVADSSCGAGRVDSSRAGWRRDSGPV